MPSLEHLHAIDVTAVLLKRKILPETPCYKTILGPLENLLLKEPSQFSQLMSMYVYRKSNQKVAGSLFSALCRGFQGDLSKEGSTVRFKNLQHLCT